MPVSAKQICFFAISTDFDKFYNQNPYSVFSYYPDIIMFKHIC